MVFLVVNSLYAGRVRKIFSAYLVLGCFLGSWFGWGMFCKSLILMVLLERIELSTSTLPM